MASSMEFWGVEVKAGVPLKVTPTENAMIHVSQAALGESKKDKGKEAVPLFVKCGDQKLVIGTLSSENFPQVPFDLVFEKEFELSHNWKGGSVYFCGYQVPIPEEGDDYPDSEFSDEEEIPLTKTENVEAAPKGDNAAAKSQAAKPESSAKQVKVIEPSKPEEGDSSEDDSDEDSEDDSDSDDESESDLMVSEGNDDDSDEEETPKKAEVVKKRPNDSALKTPVSKKAKTAIPQKTEGKKGAHTATPHPSKQAGKTPANGANPKAQTPKSGGEFSCGSCGKSFNKEVGLQSHKKAKHGGN